MGGAEDVNLSSRDCYQLCLTASARKRHLNAVVVRRDNLVPQLNLFRLLGVLYDTRIAGRLLSSVNNPKQIALREAKHPEEIYDVKIRPTRLFNRPSQIPPECRHGWLPAPDSPVSVGPNRWAPSCAQRMVRTFSPVSACGTLHSGVLNSDSLHAPKA